MNLSSSYDVDLVEDETEKMHVLLPVEISQSGLFHQEFLVPCA